MTEEALNYPRMLQNALRDVARQALEEVADYGFPGEHHFFLQLSPQHPEVIVPAFLREQYPEELTLVLQNQYWDLEVDEDRFRVTLAFGGKRHRLEIPFDALIGFSDPAANFALRFEALLPGSEDESEGHEVPEADAPPGGEPQAKATGEGDGAKVIEIDRFRKPR